jgi:hypothetical protein
MAGPASARPHPQLLLLRERNAPHRPPRRTDLQDEQVAAVRIHDSRSQFLTRAEAGLPLLWRALLRRGPTRSCCCYEKGTLLTDIPAARIYRTNRSRHYRVMAVDSAHHSTRQGLYLSSICLHASPYYTSPLHPLFAVWQPIYIYCHPHSCVLGFLGPAAPPEQLRHPK